MQKGCKALSMDTIAARGRRLGLAVILVSVAAVLAACEDSDTSSGSGTTESSTVNTQTSNSSPVVNLNPGQARISGAAQYRCWGSDCWWVVWCGHAICDGAWHWTFPSTGTYRLTWNGVNHKCAGSPPYSLAINGKKVVSGRVPQYGSCSDCAARGGYGIYENIDLGAFTIEKGDTVTLWAETHFACGLDGPGAYAAYNDMSARLR